MIQQRRYTTKGQAYRVILTLWKVALSFKEWHFFVLSYWTKGIQNKENFFVLSIKWIFMQQHLSDAVIGMTICMNIHRDDNIYIYIWLYLISEDISRLVHVNCHKREKGKKTKRSITKGHFKLGLMIQLHCKNSNFFGTITRFWNKLTLSDWSWHDHCSTTAEYQALTLIRYRGQFHKTSATSEIVVIN